MFYLIVIILTFIGLAMIEAFFDWTPYDLLEEAIGYLFIPLAIIWIPVRCLFIPVPIDRWNSVIKTMANTKVFHLFGNVYFLADAKARWYKKFFLVRVKAS